MRTYHPWLTIVLAVALAGCLTAAPDGPRSPSGSDSPDPDSTDSSEVEPLTDFEDSLSGTWRRYHVKNSGYSSEYSYYEYVSFNEDRTACKWKYGEKSSSASTDEVFDEGDYSHWEIAQQLPGGGASFRVVVEGRGLDYVFDFTKNIMYPAGYDTLVFGRNTDGKSCVYRDGASY